MLLQWDSATGSAVAVSAVTADGRRWRLGAAPAAAAACGAKRQRTPPPAGEDASEWSLPSVAGDAQQVEAPLMRSFAALAAAARPLLARADALPRGLLPAGCGAMCDARLAPVLVVRNAGEGAAACGGAAAASPLAPALFHALVGGTGLRYPNPSSPTPRYPNPSSPPPRYPNPPPQFSFY